MSPTTAVSGDVRTITTRGVRRITLRRGKEANKRFAAPVGITPKDMDRPAGDCMARRFGVRIKRLGIQVRLIPSLAEHEATSYAKTYNELSGHLGLVATVVEFKAVAVRTK